MNIISQRHLHLHACALLGAFLLPTGVMAQTAGAGIDNLIEASTSDEAALQAADAQIAEGDLTGAATTLERRLLDEPDATIVRIRYAVLLCELDDRQAAQHELSKIAAEPIEDASKAVIAAKCGASSPAAN